MVIGKIIKPWGVRGELKAVLSDISEEAFASIDEVMLSGSGTAFNITSKKFRPGCVVLKFDGLDTPEDAVLYNGASMEAEGVGLPPLEDGQYYIHEIIGLNIISSSGETLGKVSDVLSFPANDVYVMDYDGRECLIPAIADVVKEINIAGGYITIEVMEGLLG
ncbi:ribosome maturation factor RimM [Candidatus Magnetominusculus dajiuhuensis]|uniref:ribosome maturation factor RimM n=1 Tax=Candidatus Magnetominusculus dajiuhuensis TaxID=3137712 RepID=UPI003B42C6A7